MASDLESQSPWKGGVGDFSERSIRFAFIRKVYVILGLQLLITTSIVLTLSYVNAAREYLGEHMWVFWTSFGISIVLIIVLVCIPNLRRTVPANYICLFAFTLAESFLVGSIASLYAPDAVCMAIGICAAVCLALTLFAFNTKFDFTLWGGFLYVFLVIVVIFGLFSAVFYTSYSEFRILNLVYASLGALVFSLYLVFDTQLMLGGKHKYSLNPEEYVFAALNLYLDIINLFILILLLVGGGRR
ncbi:protein lifeguard 1-like [Oscarella lobularis]|uniref:protein lifeguard 1-like n=1 Tax=Oscarella lobularis TaxID=121494 RepID=UPI0033137971